MSLCTAPATRHASVQILFKSPTPANVLEPVAKSSRFAHFWQGAEPGVHFFNISTSKKCSGCDVIFAFSLPNVLRAKIACNFSTLISPDGSAPAALASLLVDPLEPKIIEKT